MNNGIGKSKDASPALKLWALVISLIIVAAGTGWTWKVGQESNHVDHQLGAASDGLAGLKKILNREGVTY